MSRLPLTLSILLLLIMLLISLPILVIVWLLGGHKPFSTYVEAISDICFNEENED